MAGDYSTLGHISPYLQAYNHYQVEHFHETKDTGAREPDTSALSTTVPGNLYRLMHICYPWDFHKSDP
jgi:hypothetical protein